MSRPQIKEKNKRKEIGFEFLQTILILMDSGKKVSKYFELLETQLS